VPLVARKNGVNVQNILG